jgi:integrase
VNEIGKYKIECKQLEEDYVWGQEAGPLTLRVNRFLKKLPNFENATSHDFRTSWATNAYNRGGHQSLQMISRYLGHSSLATTELYLKRSEESVHEEAAALFE